MTLFVHAPRSAHLGAAVLNFGFILALTSLAKSAYADPSHAALSLIGQWATPVLLLVAMGAFLAYSLYWFIEFLYPLDCESARTREARGIAPKRITQSPATLQKV